LSDQLVDPRDVCSVTLHSSWRGLALSLLGAGVVFVGGVVSMALTGGAVGSWLLLFAGSLVLGLVMSDVPISAEFDSQGVTRRSLLRRQRVYWDRVDQVTRARPAVIAMNKGLTPGGLTAKVGRRRYLLVDQCESLGEFYRLAAMLEHRQDALGVDELLPPPVDVDPTWTYRRAKWQPKSP
jgi:hypothetical protein